MRDPLRRGPSVAALLLLGLLGAVRAGPGTAPSPAHEGANAKVPVLALYIRLADHS